MGTKRLVGHIDADGEIHKGAVLALIVPKRKNGFDRHFTMNQDAMLFLARGKLEEAAKANLGADAYRVLFAVLSVVDFENWIHLNQAEMAETIGMQRQHFSRAMRKLEAIELIQRGPKIGRSVTYRLNPHFGWKGSAKNHLKAIDGGLKERMKERGLSVVPTEEPEAG
jgi:DNA-binding MarR family transcriptional regulator